MNSHPLREFDANLNYLKSERERKEGLKDREEIESE